MSEATPTLSETMLVSERDHLPWCDISRVVVTSKTICLSRSRRCAGIEHCARWSSQRRGQELRGTLLRDLKNTFLF